MKHFLKWATDMGWDTYVDILEKMDPRVDSWFLMGSPFFILILIGLYLSLVLGTGALWMRETGNNLNLYRLLVYYNATILVINMIIGSALTFFVSNANYSYVCERVRFKSFDENENYIAKWLWIYLLAKCVEMTDTFFIVIRRKKANLGFLHVYHHATIIIVTWAAVRFVPGGMTAHFAIVNCWIHAAMYIYYKISTIYGLNDYFTYKSFVTCAQIIQFAASIFIIYSAFQDSCRYPKWVLTLLFLYLMSFVIMYLKFYYDEYMGESESELSVIGNESIQQESKSQPIANVK